MCSQSFKKLRRKGLPVDLSTIMVTMVIMVMVVVMMVMVVVMDLVEVVAVVAANMVMVMVVMVVDSEDKTMLSNCPLYEIMTAMPIRTILSCCEQLNFTLHKHQRGLLSPSDMHTAIRRASERKVGAMRCY